MRTARLLLALMLAVPSLAAQQSTQISFDQPSADSRTFINATIGGLGCGALPPTVTVSGNTITIKAEFRTDVVCIATYVPIPITVPIGTLRGGVYEVVGKNMTLNGDVHTSLVVRDVDPLHVYPPGGPAAGGTGITISHDWSLETHGPLSVSFGGVPATITSRGEPNIFATAPPHAAGDVDVTVTFGSPNAGSSESTTYTLRAAYRYFDPMSAPDPFLVERLLFPLKYESVGAYGSQWTTDSVVAIPYWTAPGFVDFWYPPCSSCSTRIAATNPETVVHLDKGNSPAGTLLYVFRGTLDALAASSRFHDVSRQAESAGTEVPIVRERDFHPVVSLYNVPADPRYRAMLRVWSLKPVPGSGIDAGFVAGTQAAGVPLTFSPATAETLAFASADLTPVLQKFPAGTIGKLSINSYDTPLWAMISLTNNTTQEVTIISPQ